MYEETKKLQILEEILKIDDTAVLTEVQAVIEKGKLTKIDRRSFKGFAGRLSDSEVTELEKNIEEGCEQIHRDGWK